MAQMTRGLRSILSIPFIYNIIQRSLGQKRAYKILVSDYLSPDPQSRILDIGCGTARILDYLPREIDYVGFDLSPSYIKAAKSTYGDRGRFCCERVSRFTITEMALFDYVLAIGIIHHLDDCEATQLFQIAYQALKPGGRLLTADGVFVDGQSPVAKLLLKLDRGKNIRQKEDYEQLVKAVFNSVVTDIRYDIMPLPYTHCIMVATNSD